MGSLCPAGTGAGFTSPEGITRHVIVLAYGVDVTPVERVVSGSVGSNA